MRGEIPKAGDPLDRALAREVSRREAREMPAAGLLTFVSHGCRVAPDSAIQELPDFAKDPVRLAQSRPASSAGDLDVRPLAHALDRAGRDLYVDTDTKRHYRERFYDYGQGKALGEAMERAKQLAAKLVKTGRWRKRRSDGR